jgi:heme ABC exporter ATP-binding subunit CcmA
LLIVDKLARAYGFLWALKDVSLELPPGELVSLLGPNGAGKTTLLKLLSGLTAPTAGHIRLGGDSLSDPAPQARGRVGLLAPADHLYDHLSAEENLRFFLDLYRRRQAADRIHSMLDEMGLGERAQDYVGNLSSGLKCRLSIAKWRLLDPALLLLDEPYGVLDGSGIDLLETFLKDHCARGNIAIVASHHVSRALNLCTRALILHRGRLTFNEAKQSPWPSFEHAFGEFLPRGESWKF